MNKKAIIAVLSALVLTVVASVTLILTVGQKASAYTEHGRILVLDDWDDFLIDTYANYVWGLGTENTVVCRRVSDEVGLNVLGFEYYSDCGYFGGDMSAEKENQYDEVHVIFPDGIKVIDGLVMFDWSGWFGSKVTYVRIPASVEVIGSGQYNSSFYGLKSAKFYCECSEEYANEHWGTGWNYVGMDYDYVNDNDIEIYGEVVYDCNKTIEFDVNGGNETFEDQTVCVDSLVTKPTDPTKEGYTFKGWYNGEEEYDFATPVTADMTLTAQWEAIPEQPEPSNPEQPTTPENPEQPTTPDTDTETVTVGSKNGFNIGAAIGGGLVAGLGSISAIAATVIVRRRHK